MADPVLLIVMIVFVGGMLFMSSRSKKKQMAAQQAKLNAVVPGARITTISGLQGTVTAVADDTMELEIAPGVRTTWLRAAVRDVIVAAPTADDLDSTDDDAVDVVADSSDKPADSGTKDVG